MKRVYLMVAFALCLALPLAGQAAESKGTKSGTSDAAADNTRQNKQHSQEMTADQQSENEADRKLSQQIRQAIVKDKSLSQYAHNVKIITRDGAVTLKGPVRNAKEKAAVEKAARQVAGKGKVTSELEVAPKKKKASDQDSDKNSK